MINLSLSYYLPEDFHILWQKRLGAESTHPENWSKRPTYQARYDPPPKLAEMTLAEMTHAEMTQAEMTHAEMTQAEMTHAEMTQAEMTQAETTPVETTPIRAGHEKYTTYYNRSHNFKYFVPWFSVEFSEAIHRLDLGYISGFIGRQHLILNPLFSESPFLSCHWLYQPLSLVWHRLNAKRKISTASFVVMVFHSLLELPLFFFNWMNRRRTRSSVRHLGDLGVGEVNLRYCYLPILARSDETSSRSVLERYLVATMVIYQNYHEIPELLRNTGTTKTTRTTNAIMLILQSLYIGRLVR